jgi:hypothetical protein
MNIILDNGINVLAIAAQCSGLPGLTGAGMALAALAQCCDNVKVQKVRMFSVCH